jgi:hypothetical protein
MGSRFDVAEAHLLQGLAAARAQGTPSLIAVLLCGLAVPVYYQGRLSEAASLTREAAVLSERLGKTPNAVFARGNLAAIELAMDALEPAREEAETAIRLARHSGGDSALSGCLATLGEIHLRAGRPRDAAIVAEEALQIATAVGNTLQGTHAQYVLAGVELREGRRDRALARLCDMRAWLAQHRIAVRVPLLIVGAAECALASDEPAERATGQRWLLSMLHAPDIDATLRGQARRLLGRDGGLREDAEGSPTSLEMVEAEVAAFLGASPAAD